MSSSVSVQDIMGDLRRKPYLANNSVSGQEHRVEPTMTSASANTPPVAMAPHKDISGRAEGGGPSHAYHIYPLRCSNVLRLSLFIQKLLS
uniref:Uncharacterized protein n=1 Tax=Knipowitschia caucasica TaxID=637954 RepID=A0AAV2JZC7_KNICA